MKKIIGYRKLMGVGEQATLQDLKTVYRNLMKQWHPDKFEGDDEKRAEADAKGKHIIEAYHFLVSIAPETLAQNLEEYTKTINLAGISDYEYKNETLLVKYSDGANYEYFGVTKAIYNKLMSAPAPARFVRRHICGAFPYRAANKAVEA